MVFITILLTTCVILVVVLLNPSRLDSDATTTTVAPMSRKDRFLADFGIRGPRQDAALIDVVPSHSFNLLETGTREPLVEFDLDMSNEGVVTISPKLNSSVSRPFDEWLTSVSSWTRIALYFHAPDREGVSGFQWKTFQSDVYTKVASMLGGEKPLPGFAVLYAVPKGTTVDVSALQRQYARMYPVVQAIRCSDYPLTFGFQSDLFFVENVGLTQACLDRCANLSAITTSSSSATRMLTIATASAADPDLILTWLPVVRECFGESNVILRLPVDSPIKKRDICNLDTPLTFFRLDNPLDVAWTHAANSRAAMTEAIAMNDNRMLEADIVMGTVVGSESADVVPIMAHPPETTSDLSFDEWLRMAHTRHDSMGIKLDFKEYDAWMNGTAALQSLHMREPFNCPIWLNADVLKGGGAKNAFGLLFNISGPTSLQLASLLPSSCLTFVFFVAPNMVELARVMMPATTYSFGWSTKWSNSASDLVYSSANVDEMIQLIDNLNITQPITFPVRAAMLQSQSAVSALTRLLDHNAAYSLTVWTSKADTVDPAKLAQYARPENYKKRIYFDLFEPLASNFTQALGLS